MPQPTSDATTDVTVDTNPLTNETTVVVTKYSDATKKTVVSKETRIFKEGGNWDHYVVRYYYDIPASIVDGAISVLDIDRVSQWDGNKPKKHKRTIRIYRRLIVRFPGSSYERSVDELKTIIEIREDGSIWQTTITENHVDGTPSAGITMPISPPGPPQAWSPNSP